MLPPGFTVGHSTRLDWATGCTVVLVPDRAVASAEVRGGGPGTRETDLLAPAAPPRPIQALAFSGGSAHGLATADGVAGWLRDRGIGHRTRIGHLIPLVPAAVVYDLALGAERWPDPEAAAEACEAATAEPARGTVGAGTGCSVGKLLGPEHATKGGVGLASERVGECTVAALAVVNAIGDVIGEDGAVLAGPWRDGAYVRTVDILRAGATALPFTSGREATTLICVMTDARLDKADVWLLARSASTGAARAVDPTATQFDGDAAFAIAAGGVRAEPLVLQAIVPHVVSAAIRDAVRQATSLEGCVAARER